MSASTAIKHGRTAVAYIRRSKVEAASPGDVSRDTQMAAIKAMTPEDVRVFEDWGVSGRGKSRHKRTAFGDMLALVAEGKVSTVYAYNLSRLGRSVRDVLELATLCAEHGTAIRLGDGQNVDASNATGRMLIGILATVDEWQAEVQAERTTGVLAAWREAHPDERLGRKRYGADPERPEESIAVVLKAFETERSFLGAAKMLNRMEVPTRQGGLWDVRTVSRIIRRDKHVRDGHDGTLDPCEKNCLSAHVHQERPCSRCYGKARKGAAAVARRIFTGLLKCACGDTLTSMPRKGSIGWYCQTAHRNPTHPRPYVVAEPKIVAWAERELAGMRTMVLARGTLPDAGAIMARLADIDSKRDRIVDMYADGTLSKIERDKRLGLLAADRAKTQASLDVSGPGTLFLGNAIDWAADPAEVNAAIRTYWSAIILNGGMLPKRAVWVPTEDWTEEGPA